MYKYKKIITYFGLSIALVIVAMAYVRFIMFPYQLEAKFFFKFKADSYNALADELERHSNIRQVSILGDSVWLDKYDSPISEEIHGVVAEQFKKLILDSKMMLSWKIKDGVLMYISSANKFGRRFNVAYVRKNIQSEAPECRVSLTKEEFGTCEFILNERWVLNYEWYPSI